MKQKSGGIKRLMEFTGKHRGLLTVSRILSGISSVFILGPFLCVYFAARDLVGVFAGTPLDTNSLVRWGLLALGLELIGLVLYFSALLCSHVVAFHTEKTLKMAALKHLAKMPMGYFDANPSGKLRKIIDDNSFQTETFIAHQLPDLVGAQVTMIVSYGISVGRNGMACCPFHDDKHPSMKVDRRFHCFACQADGDVIDFTSRLFGLSSKEAALKLAEDFSISFDRKGHDPPQKRVIKRKISEEMRYRQAEQKCFRVLCDYLRLLERWKEEYAPKQPEDDWNPLFVEALHRQPYIEYLLDLLLSDSIEERAFVVAEYGKEVRKIEQRISEFIASHPAGCDERSRSHSAGTER